VWCPGFSFVLGGGGGGGGGVGEVGTKTKLSPARASLLGLSLAKEKRLIT
jgi:hypothetical protein